MDRTRRIRMFDNSGIPKRHRITMAEEGFVRAETGRPDPWAPSVHRLMDAIESGGICMIVGDRGRGKTQLATEAARRFATERPFNAQERTGSMATWSPIRYILMSELIMGVRDSYRRDSNVSEKEYVNEFIKPELLIVDELQEGATEHGMRMLTLIVDRRYGDGEKATILIANVAKESLADLVGPSITDRTIEAGAVIDTNGWTHLRPMLRRMKGNDS